MLELFFLSRIFPDKKKCPGPATLTGKGIRNKSPHLLADVKKSDGGGGEEKDVLQPHPQQENDKQSDMFRQNMDKK